MEKKVTRLCFSVLAMCLTVSALSLQADPIEVINPGFEIPGTGEVLICLPEVTGWDAYEEGVACADTNTNVQTKGAIEGSWCASDRTGVTIFQLLDHNIAALNKYTLTYKAKDLYMGETTDPSFYYLENEADPHSWVLLSTGHFDVSESVAEYTLEFIAEADAPYLGKKIGILLNSTRVAGPGSGWISHDCVQVDLVLGRGAINPSPENGALHIETDVVLQWEVFAVTNPSYEVYFSTDPCFTGVTPVARTETNYDPSGDQDYATVHYWRVDTVEDGGPAKYEGMTWTYTTLGKAWDPVPIDEDVVTPGTLTELSWSGDAVTESYDVYFGTNPASLPKVDSVTDPCYPINPATLNELTTYYWRVDERTTAEGMLAMGDLWSFDLGGLVAHWKFDDGSGSTTAADSSSQNNLGTLAGDLEPNWVSGWVGSDALEFFGTDILNSYVDIATDSSTDPNLDNIQREISLSAWIKTTEINSIIIADGNNTWRMGLSGSQIGKLYFSCNGTQDPGLYSESIVNDGYWHHVAAVYDGSTASFYVDGVFDSSVGRTGLIDINDLPVTIGVRHDDATTVSHSFNGMIDDVRVYSYGISAAQVADLADMGINLIPRVDAGENQTFSVQYGYLKLDGTVIDDGKPEAATLAWTKTSGPGDVDFSDTAIEDPCVTFSEVGIYLLRLTADDTLAEVYDEVTIEVASPTCQDVISDGLLIPVDISGPGGNPDCYINLYDFAAFAGNWFRCNNPQDPECEFPF